MLRPVESETEKLKKKKNATNPEWSDLLVTSTPDKISNYIECFPLVNNCPHCSMSDFRLFENGLITLRRLIGSNNCFFKIIADIFHPECSRTGKQNVCCHRGVHTCSKSITQMPLISSTWRLLTFLMPVEAVSVYLMFSVL